MFINLSPLKNNNQYRLLFLGQTVSFFGSMMSYVAIPYQIYQLTQSSFQVGLLGVVQLVPLIFAGMYGGALADNMDRKKLLLMSETALSVCTCILVINSLLPNPSVILLFVAAGLSSVFVGLHRPAMEAITPQIVSKEDYPAVAALGGLRYSMAAIAAPALGGWLIAQFGIAWTYSFDTLTYVFSLICLYKMNSVAAPKSEKGVSIASIVDGLKYAVKNTVILGTYVADIVAMIFAMPMALFPSMAAAWGGANAAGWLYSAIPMGALVISLLSGRFSEYKRYGAGVIGAAVVWGIFIICLAFAMNLYVAVACLALAGSADAVSAIYRQTIWNESIPMDFRGRLAGLNMLSYMIGPMLGNARAGLVASISSNYISILSGGILCVVNCLAMIWILPKFWNYRSAHNTSEKTA